MSLATYYPNTEIVNKKFFDGTLPKTDDSKEYTWTFSESLSEEKPATTSRKRRHLFYSSGELKLTSIKKETTDKSITTRLIDAWIDKMLSFLNDYDNEDSEWLKKSISISERYLISLKSDKESRLFISGYIMMLRSSANSLNDTNLDKFKKLIFTYRSSDKNPKNRLSFVRNARQLGISPSNIGSIND